MTVVQWARDGQVVKGELRTEHPFGFPDQLADLLYGRSTSPLCGVGGARRSQADGAIA